jgi:hypothetical protein
VEPPSKAEVAHFYINNRSVYREAGHPEGSSSIPWYVVRRSRVLSSEGYPTGPSERAHYEIRTLRAKGVPTRVRRNPESSQGV